MERGARNHILQEAKFIDGIDKKNAVCLMDVLFKLYPKYRPIKQTVRVRNLRQGGKKNSSEGAIRSQLSEAPPIIEEKAKIKVGIEQKISLSKTGCIGLILVGPHKTASKNRVVYVTVRPVAKKNKIKTVMLEK